MIKDVFEEAELVKPDLTKYRLAGFGFLVLNVLYIIIAWWKLPPVDLEINKVVHGGFLAFIAFVLILTPLILRGKKFLVQVLAFIYGGRAAFFYIFFDKRGCVSSCSLFVAMFDSHVLSIGKGSLGLAVVVFVS